MRVFQTGFLSALAIALITGCLQGGLVSENAETVRRRGQGQSSSLFSQPTSNPVARAQTVAASDGNGYSNPYYRVTFGNKRIAPVTVGFGIIGADNCGAEPGTNFCFSNERIARPSNSTDASFFDSLCPCAQPFTGQNDREDDVLKFLKAEDATGYPFIIQALQLSFSQSVAVVPDAEEPIYTPISVSNITVWTAPIKPQLNAVSNLLGELQWDPAGELAEVYEGTGACDPARDSDAVGFRLTASQNNRFLTGLWSFERGEWEPFETSQPRFPGVLTEGNAQLSGAFSTRTNLYGSLVIPNIIDSLPKHLFLPSEVAGSVGGDDEPGPSPNPAKFVFGRYTGNLPVGNGNFYSGDTLPENQVTPIEGLYATPMMGKFSRNGTLNLMNNTPVVWNQRVITGICVRGTRRLFSGSPTQFITYPLIHAMKVELRKIQVKIE